MDLWGIDMKEVKNNETETNGYTDCKMSPRHSRQVICRTMLILKNQVLLEMQ